MDPTASSGNPTSVCMSIATTSYIECEVGCTSVPDCIGFDVDVNEYCNARFTTSALLTAANIPSGWGRWHDGCDGCDTT